MAPILKWVQQIWQKPPSPRRPEKTSGFVVLDKTQKFEEEQQAWYTPIEFYSVRIGEIFNARYQVIGKLGYGAYSTVWLCRDLKYKCLQSAEHQYITLKVSERNSTQAAREVVVFKHLNSLTTEHGGSRFVRTALDTFELTTSEGSYQCLVHKPLGMHLCELQCLFSSGTLPENILKTTLTHVLFALDFLHTEARLVHTGELLLTASSKDPLPLVTLLQNVVLMLLSDVHGKNILLGIDDEKVLAEFEEAERRHPSARKIDGKRVIHTSRQLGVHGSMGRPVLCDFGESRIGEHDHEGRIQPHQYRAPEVILEMAWNNKVDIWNVGVMVSSPLYGLLSPYFEPHKLAD